MLHRVAVLYQKGEAKLSQPVHVATARLQGGSQLQIPPETEDSDGDHDDHSVAASLDVLAGCEEEGFASEEDDDAFEFHPACVVMDLEQWGKENIWQDIWPAMLTLWILYDDGCTKL